MFKTNTDGFKTQVRSGHPDNDDFIPCSGMTFYATTKEIFFSTFMISQGELGWGTPLF